MSRVLAQHKIEQFVTAWLTKLKNSVNVRREKKYIQKAIQQINFFLNPPCCIDPEATIEFRRLDNDLTRFIAAQFAQGAFDRRKWRKSLERAALALNNSIFDPCCFITLDFARTGDNCCGIDPYTPYTLSIVDDDNFSVVIPCISAGNPPSGTFSFPKGLSGSIKLQLHLNDNGNYATLTAYDADNNVLANIEDTGAGPNTSGIGVGTYQTTAFEASLLDHIGFGCSNSG